MPVPPHFRQLVRVPVLLALSATAVAQTTAGLPVFLREPTGAMTPEIPAGTLLVQEPVVGPLSPGDLVLVREPRPRGALLARRVAALPGSRLESVDDTLLIDGRATAASWAGLPLGRVGLVFDPAMPTVYRVPPDAYLVLADNLGVVPEVRWSGVVGRAAIVGRLSKWSDASRDKAVARRFLERSFANLNPQLPIKLNEEMTLTSISIDEDNRITYATRIEGDYPGPLSEDNVAMLGDEVRRSFCRSQLARYSDHLQLIAVISDQKRALATVSVSNCDPLRRGD